MGSAEDPMSHPRSLQREGRLWKCAKKSWLKTVQVWLEDRSRRTRGEQTPNGMNQKQTDRTTGTFIRKLVGTRTKDRVVKAGKAAGGRRRSPVERLRISHRVPWGPDGRGTMSCQVPEGEPRNLQQVEAVDTKTFTEEGS